MHDYNEYEDEDINESALDMTMEDAYDEYRRHLCKVDDYIDHMDRQRQKKELGL